ncbi:MAG: hypothetical protein R3F08_06175 [Dokdonella sp.]
MTTERRSEELVGSDVASTSLPAHSDLSDWIELMDAIEALCPVWPEHPAREAGIYKL